MLNEFVRIIFGAGMFINAALFIPQVIRILKTKNTQGLSLITFVGFCLIQSSTIAYGYIQKDLLLMVGYALSLFTCGTVCILILIYRNKKERK